MMDPLLSRITIDPNLAMAERNQSGSGLRSIALGPARRQSAPTNELDPVPVRLIRYRSRGKPPKW